MSEPVAVEADVAERIVATLKIARKGITPLSRPSESQFGNAAEAIAKVWKSSKGDEAALDVLLNDKKELRMILDGAKKGLEPAALEQLAATHYEAAHTTVRELARRTPPRAVAEPLKDAGAEVKAEKKLASEIEESAAKPNFVSKFWNEAKEAKLLKLEGAWGKKATLIAAPVVLLGGAWAMSHGRSKDDPKAEVESQIQGQAAATGRA